MRKFLLVLVAILATAAALAQCGGDEAPAESFETCTSCDALEVSPQQGKVPCNGACSIEPAADDTYKCVGATDGVGGTCVPVSESYNMCGGGVDDDADGLTDCDDPDCATNLLCVPVPCEPDCKVGNECGSDGCGGSCGTCAAGETCMDNGTCFCAPQCGGKNCGDNGCGGTCGTCPVGMTCSGAGLCEVTCVPDCEGKVCGNDGCDGECGPGCADDEVCTAVGGCILANCTKQCDDKECGPDGCGSFCGVCGLGEECNATGNCEVVPCEPVCAVGNECGSDGCGGTCGVCAVGETCLANGTCMCAPQCGGKNCGDDGCGETCGTCPAGMTCGATGLCAADPCVPNCGVKKCGTDGCGGECGTCAAGEECTAEGLCIPTGPMPPAEICDNGMDDDGDGNSDADDFDCAGKVVATLGIYIAYPAFLKVETADGQSWEGDLPGDWTAVVTVEGGEVPAHVWIQTKTVSATGPQGFVVWDGGVGVSPPAWPAGAGLPVGPGKSFSASFSEATWFNFELSGFGGP